MRKYQRYVIVPSSYSTDDESSVQLIEIPRTDCTRTSIELRSRFGCRFPLITSRLSDDIHSTVYLLVLLIVTKAVIKLSSFTRRLLTREGWFSTVVILNNPKEIKLQRWTQLALWVDCEHERKHSYLMTSSPAMFDWKLMDRMRLSTWKNKWCRLKTGENLRATNLTYDCVRWKDRERALSVQWRADWPWETSVHFQISCIHNILFISQPNREKLTVSTCPVCRDRSSFLRLLQSRLEDTFRWIFNRVTLFT